MRPAVPVITAVVTVRDAYWDSPSIYGNSISGEVLLSLSSAPTGTIKVAYTIGGNAQAGADYGTLTGKVKFRRGETSKVIAINPVYTGGSGSVKLLKLKLAGGNGYTVKTTSAPQNSAPSLFIRITLTGVGIFAPGRFVPDRSVTSQPFRKHAGRRLRLDAVRASHARSSRWTVP